CFVIHALIDYSKDMSFQFMGSISAAFTALASAVFAWNTAWVYSLQNLINSLDKAMFYALGVVAFTTILTMARSLIPNYIWEPIQSDTSGIPTPGCT
ncbi:MAG TPA: hypothetical protein VHU84_02215, partial [Lacipirellulaceae bacterium]|nr:hypothetical protein [Lacipirellulaceae bacterium]